MRRPLQNNSSPGQAVYDPFLGSGTTLIAAETAGRVCLGMELDGFQLPTIFAPITTPNSMSVRRDSPRHMTILPGGGSLARAR
jgi:hypothetical protein